ncbi:uncharacterized protein LTR77_010944 [Saxophila tyrrhenica]|uniref:DUF7907 domain-containing protein n=1 Tax=Saxophila tyrrhenica TaxID=1690608 RepID=A0AAV9NWP0_9PEZI|nr:hypothetical protein LTR77_010944 [Saxophila tyrrhenica]
MKFTLAILTTLVAAAAARQSKPFHLKAVSDNSTVDGTYFFACHEGAAIEGLCIGSKKLAQADNFRLNNTRSQPNVGSLAWLLKGGNFKVSETMTLYTDPSTNVALPLFEPGYDSAYVGFDSDDKMYIRVYLDDTKNPPNSVNGKKLYRWLTCTTYYTGYTYQTLAWQLGEAEAQNPTCEPVTVKRVFVNDD